MLKPTSPSNIRKRNKCQASNIHMEGQKTKLLQKHQYPFQQMFPDRGCLSKFWPSLRQRASQKSLSIHVQSSWTVLVQNSSLLSSSTFAVATPTHPSLRPGLQREKSILLWSILTHGVNHKNLIFHLSYTPKADIYFCYIQTRNGWKKLLNSNECYNWKL